MFEVSQRIFFQARPTLAIEEICRQSFKFSRGQHATNEAVEHFDTLLAVFFNDPLLHRADQNFAKVNSGNAQYSLGGLGTIGSAVPGHSRHRDDGHLRPLVLAP